MSNLGRVAQPGEGKASAAAKPPPSRTGTPPTPAIFEEPPYVPFHTEYFWDGDPFTEGLRSNEWMDMVRAMIAEALGEGDTGGAADIHYGSDNLFTPEDRKRIAWYNAASILTNGLWGMPIEQEFLGSYDLKWNVVGVVGNEVVVEFHVTNASTLASANPDPSKVQNYTNESAGDGNDAFPGETWTRQSIRWRESFPGGQAPAGPEPALWNPWPFTVPDPYDPIFP